MSGPKPLRRAAGVIFLVFLAVAGVGLPAAAAGPVPQGQEEPVPSAAKELIVRGDVEWTDTGIDVSQNDELVVTATGGISLQRGNPTAYCGPDGYNMQTAQQPIPGKNIGSLVGRVVQLISVTRDPETNKEVRDELIEVFYVGSKARVLMPIAGRVFLGPNENVVGDNSGSFKVSISRISNPERPAARPEDGPGR